MSAVLSHVRNNKDPLNQTRFHAQFSTGDASCDFEAGSILHVGLDWGASQTCLQGAFAGAEHLLVDECIPTVVGYAKDGIVDGVLPRNETTLFGREALTHRRHLHLAYPSIDSAAARHYARHLRSRIEAPAGTQIRAVIAAPPTLDAHTREKIRLAISRHFESVMFLPQPYLAALGYRDESRLGATDYVDPIRNSLFIDIGMATTTLCMVQGYYPTATEQFTVDFGGNHIEKLLRAAILEDYPDAELSPITLRHLKEQHAFAGMPKGPVNADVVIAGKARTIDLREPISAAGNELLTRICEATQKLLRQVECDDVGELLSNIILTGGGSRIKNISPELERLLGSEGFASPRVRTLGEAYKRLAAAGALKAARQAREHHWMQLAR